MAAASVGRPARVDLRHPHDPARARRAGRARQSGHAGRVGGGYGGSPGGSPPPHTSNGSSVTLSFRGVVADGRLTDAEVVALLGTAS
ncbi:MAG: hypothetical protein WC591_05055 [Microbacterium sp.]|nr:hypothetical protein [Microbacterium profundi]MCE7482732.1 hypothetical protein [Microbacterium profundi]